MLKLLYGKGCSLSS